MAGKELQIGTIFAALLLVQAILTTLSGGLFFTRHEADMVHLTSLVLRQSGGELYHLDISTPIGGWSTLPMAILHKAGFGLGSAMLWGQVSVFALIAPFAAIIMANRLTLGQAALFAVLLSGLITGLVFGGTDSLISLSMSYNRWCWAVALVIALAVLLPGRRPNSVSEGVVIGLLMASMAMVKASYPVALALPVIFGLLRNGRTIPLLAAIFSATALLAAVTLATGFEYWRAYAADLLIVAGSDHRSAPGLDWSALVASPAGLPATLVVFGMAIFAGRLDRRDMAGTLFLFFAAFTFMTWQNFGNDPIWLAALAMVGWVLSRQGQGSAARGMRTVSIVAGVLILPVILNIIWSPARHLMTPRDLFNPVLAQEPDLQVLTARTDTILTTNVISAPTDEEPEMFRGEALTDCTIAGGFIATLRRDAEALRQLAPEIDRQPLVADYFQAHWMFADLRPLQGGAPWYYDGLPGIEDATHVLVPDCPSGPKGRTRITALLDEADLSLEEAGRTQHFRLFRIVRQE